MSTSKALAAPVCVCHYRQEGTSLTMPNLEVVLSLWRQANQFHVRKHNKQLVHFYCLRLRVEVDKNSLAEFCKNLLYICKRKHLFF